MLINDIFAKMKDGVFIIAEIGKNFIQTEAEQSVEVYLENAKHLVDLAIANGTDAVKFQTHNVEDEQLNLNVISPHFKGADRYAWVSRNTHSTPLADFWRPLSEYCQEKGIIFFSTPMSRGAAYILDGLDVPLWKIGSGDILDFVLLDFVRKSGKPIIISTGMSTEEELDKAVAFIKEKNDQLVLLHCVSKYPCPPEDLNLGTINYLKEKYNVPVGFSDHSIGVEQDLIAVAAGATVVEKHFSLSRDLWGADHKVSMLPEELLTLSNGIRDLIDHPEKKTALLNTEMAKKALSNKGKVLQDGEAQFRPLFRKSLMAGRDIPEGAILTAEMIYAMRPQQFAGGMPSEEYPKVLGKKVKTKLQKYDPITWDILA